MKRKLFVAAGTVALAALTLGAAACTSGAKQEPTPVQTWKITPASGTRPPATPTTAATAAPTGPAGTATAGTPAAGTTFTVTGENVLFDKTSLAAPAGPVTIEFVNKDSGVQHNFHVFKGSSATGESVGLTPINTGPATDTLTLTLEKGDYYYQCDVHPTTMSGKLTVN